MTFDEFFKSATGGEAPYPYQRRFAAGHKLPQLLSVPTGVGKTATAVLGWLWRRRFAAMSVQSTTPRRLVFCLPMRTLVEQTAGECAKWLTKLALREKVGVHILMGGEDASDWDHHPDRDTILIGTQDMLLSRALNRGYGMSRYRWPMHFGLLNNDCLWVLDETQLMGCGLFTSAQLDLFGKIWPREKTSHFVWMSATIGDSFLRTADRLKQGLSTTTPITLEADDLADERLEKRLNAKKAIELLRNAPPAKRILEHHQDGRITLLIVNTVPVARALFRELAQQIAKTKRFNQAAPPVWLLHGRFRPEDRQRSIGEIKAFIARADSISGTVQNDPGLIIVSTQVIEAGFDLSSVRLWSEVAPWASVVQRLGRLNRAGLEPSALASFWMPKDDKERENHKSSPNVRRIGPYEKAELQTAKKLIERLVDLMSKGSEYREALVEVSATKEAKSAVEVEPDSVIRPNDFLELFATEPDLAGGFTDVSHFVRSSDRNADVQVFWRELERASVPDSHEPPPKRGELCSIPVFELQRFVAGRCRAFEWNGETRAWEARSRSEICPGMTLMLDQACGGYSDSIGWTGNSRDKPTTLPNLGGEAGAIDSDSASFGPDWVSLADHLLDAEAEAAELTSSLELTDELGKAVVTAARWHDWGKSLQRWQDAVFKTTKASSERIQSVLADTSHTRFHEIINNWAPRFNPPNQDSLWAKFPDVGKLVETAALPVRDAQFLKKTLYSPFRPDHRHEAASALGAWDNWRNGDATLTALAVYLIACHHGKVRTVMRRTSRTPRSDAFGLRATDVLVAVGSFATKSMPVAFACCRFGATGRWSGDSQSFEIESPSWLQMVVELIGTGNSDDSCEVVPADEPSALGPLALGYLEALVCIADIRASKKPGKGRSSE